MAQSGEVSDADLVRLEWQWLPVLQHTRYGLPTLQRALSADPEFFVTVLGFAFRADNEERPREVQPEQAARAQQAWQVLHDWSRPPGLDADGSLDATAFSAWVAEARRLCAEQGYKDIGDLQIGELLAYVPAGADGLWPHEALRDLLESVDSPNLERGVLIGVHNKRGVTCRAHDEGGEQERVLAAGYRDGARRLASDKPRTAALLGRLADSYDREAEEHDEDRDAYEFL